MGEVVKFIPRQGNKIYQQAGLLKQYIKEKKVEVARRYLRSRPEQLKTAIGELAKELAQSDNDTKAQ